MQVKHYSDKELEEFREIINNKLKVARQSYNEAMATLSNKSNNTDADTAPTYHVLEEGTEVIERENLIQKAQREYKFIQSLEAALVRIENKTYGIDRVTGELIPKDRLRLVPHATLSVATKNARKK
ncbi:MAG: TraR/DksA family transcriptional regulator [Prevotella sp.]|nr:TraR/DksA family transcriptional regulator [Prevotella sp.]MDD7190261.1 TraR/DksA family transcriptional regulator [Prevotella sp.]MDY5313471.1 TraR/DksA family transcriptional regulator [Prevotella sp.]